MKFIAQRLNFVLLAAIQCLQNFRYNAELLNIPDSILFFYINGTRFLYAIENSFICVNISLYFNHLVPSKINDQLISYFFAYFS